MNARMNLLQTKNRPLAAAVHQNLATTAPLNQFLHTYSYVGLVYTEN